MHLPVVRCALVVALVAALCARSATALSREERAEINHAAWLHQNALDFETCAHKRSDAIDCGLRYADTNHDGYVTPEEIEAVKRRYLSPIVLATAWVLEKIGVEGTATIMQKCDFDKDGRISRDDFERSIGTCLATCKKVNTLFSIICDRAIMEEKVKLHEQHAHMTKN